MLWVCDGVPLTPPAESNLKTCLLWSTISFSKKAAPTMKFSNIFLLVSLFGLIALVSAEKKELPATNGLQKDLTGLETDASLVQGEESSATMMAENTVRSHCRPRYVCRYYSCRKTYTDYGPSSSCGWRTFERRRRPRCYRGRYRRRCRCKYRCTISNDSDY